MELHVELAPNKRLRTFETSPQGVIEQAATVLALFKEHTPPDVLAEALQGHGVFASRQLLGEERKGLAHMLVELDHYMKEEHSGVCLGYVDLQQTKMD